QKTSTRDDVSVELEYYPGTTFVKHKKQPELGGGGFQQTYYDAIGRVSMESINDSHQWKNKRYAYDTRGQLTHEWGSGQNPVEYEYNDYGWKTKMRLYRGTGVNWDNGTWPGSGQVYDQTTWSFTNTQGGVKTGLVFSKTDPGGSSVSFTYNDRGQVKTRTWARGVTTTYTYEESTGYRTGEIKKIDYGDSTPDVSFYYSNFNGKFSRTGRVRRVYDATGWHEFFHRSNDDQLQAQRLSSTWYGAQSSNSRQIYRSYDTLGRPSRVRLGWEDSAHAGNDLTTANLEVESIHYYSAVTGRLSKLTGHRPYIVGADFNYEYQPGSDQVSAVDGGWYVEGFRRETEWQSWREVIKKVETKWNTSLKGKFDYTLDDVGQSSNRSAIGSIFENLGYEEGIKDEYLYTARGEVYNAQARDLSNNALIPNRQRIWNHDSQGNRDDEWKNGVSRDYVPNNSNEYDSVAGISFSHDADGNLTGDGVWTYTWDAENRLATAAHSSSGVYLEFKYDYQNRRVRKIERSYGILVSDRRYIYDGWNVIAELAGPSTLSLVRTFTWGLDTTGTLHGGGGVGGLLMISEGYTFYLPVYDANGNVHGLIKNSGAFAAVYGYSASGELIQSAGTYATANPIRFASKWYDTQTGLYQYNHRYYSPSLGRFISRDPIAENGGLNLYAYCGNDPVNRWDHLGQFVDGEATLFVANALFSMFENYVLGKIFGGRPDRPKMFDTYTDTWRAGARFADTFGGLGTPAPLRHGPIAMGWNAADEEAQSGTISDGSLDAIIGLVGGIDGQLASELLKVLSSLTPEEVQAVIVHMSIIHIRAETAAIASQANSVVVSVETIDAFYEKTRVFDITNKLDTKGLGVIANALHAIKVADQIGPLLELLPARVRARVKDVEKTLGERMDPVGCMNYAQALLDLFTPYITGSGSELAVAALRNRLYSECGPLPTYGP
ncbi:MAG: RHS repeat-associated core domain-containing protein, partial [Opitutaceae bacterium]